MINEQWTTAFVLSPLKLCHLISKWSSFKREQGVINLDYISRPSMRGKGGRERRGGNLVKRKKGRGRFCKYL